MEKPIYPLKNMSIIQGYNVGTHVESYAIDDEGKDLIKEDVFAPFTGIIRKICTSNSNEVWLESVEKVEYPDGTIDYMTILLAHANNITNLYPGQKIIQGSKFYETGSKGDTIKNICHIECGKGKFIEPGWCKKNGRPIINNQKKPQECLWINNSITIINDNNYKFKNMDNPSKIQDRSYITYNENNNKDINKLKHIFTCEKDGIYAIKLKKNQQLFLK